MAGTTLPPRAATRIFIARIKRTFEDEKSAIPRAFPTSPIRAIQCRRGNQVRTTVSRANGSPWRSGAGRTSSRSVRAAAGGIISPKRNSPTSCIRSTFPATASPRLPERRRECRRYASFAAAVPMRGLARVPRASGAGLDLSFGAGHRCMVADRSAHTVLSTGFNSVAAAPPRAVSSASSTTIPAPSQHQPVIIHDERLVLAHPPCRR